MKLTKRQTVSTPAHEDSGASSQMIDVRKVADLLACSVRHVYRLADSGRMPAPIKLGSLVRWHQAELKVWLEMGCPSMRKVARHNA